MDRSSGRGGAGRSLDELFLLETSPGLASGEIATAERICPRCLRRLPLGLDYCPDDGLPLFPVRGKENPRVGQVIDGRLTLLGVLGVGGMGTVYRALQHSMEREVAVKLLLPVYSEDPVLVRRFLHEARGVSRLYHPNIISLFDFGRSPEGDLYLVMELLHGRTLREVVAEGGPLAPRRAVELTGQICDALQAAHDAGVVHRDVKPDNVFLLPGAGRAGEFVKVIDFGLAKVRAAEGQSASSQSGAISGTPAYMSPEQALAQPVDGRADLYATGVLLYELLTGRLPFEKDQATKMLLAHVLEEPPPLAEALPGLEVPAALEEAVQRALAKDPEARQPSAAALKEELGRAVARPAGARGSKEPSRPPPRGSAEASSFVGRTAEIAALDGFFHRGDRLVTVLGPAGMGKTRLVGQYASIVRRHQGEGPFDGVWTCELAETRDLDGVCLAVARGLDLALTGGQGAAAAVDQLGAALSARGDCLVVLDNFEQLVGSARESLGRWLDAAPRARFLVTSREVLRLPGETVYDLPPLTLPGEGGDPRECEAVRLFLDRALSARSSWTAPDSEMPVVGEIVRELDGIPLAIELAAARMAILSPRKLLARLEARLDVLGRGTTLEARRTDTLRAAIDWSWNLLEPWEQSALAQLAVFSGGFSLEAVEAVLDLSEFHEVPWAGEAVQALREKSLVHLSSADEDDGDLRFGLYESIRHYALERLGATGRAEATAERHAAHFLRVGAAWAEASTGPEGPEVRRQLARDRENLVAVHRRALASPPSAAAASRALRAVLALDPLLATRGPFGTHLGLLDGALEAASGQGVEAGLLCRAVTARGEARRSRGQPAEALADFQQALALAREARDRRMEGRVLWCHGTVADAEGRLSEALVHFTSALGIHREVGDRLYEGKSIGLIGMLSFWLGNLEEARESIERAIDILEEVSEQWFLGFFLGTLGAVHQERGDQAEARKAYERGVEVLRRVGARRHEGMFTGYLGGLEWEQGRLAEARRYLGTAHELAREVGDRRLEAVFLSMLAGIDATEDRIGRSLERFESAERLLRDSSEHATFRGAVVLHRGHLELALARRAEAEGDRVAADSRRATVEAALEEADPGDESAVDDRPLARRSDDVRFALRMLRRALDWRGRPRGAPAR